MSENDENPLSGEYDSKEADYILRESLFNLKGNIDLISFGILDDLKEDERSDFVKKLRESVDTMYSQLNSKIIQRANRIKELNSIIKKDLRLAQRIQENILPKSLESFGELEVYAYYNPLSVVGGDFYDITLLDNGGVRVFIADATGHGVQAALTTMLIKSEYEKAKSSVKPHEAMASLNRQFAQTYRSLNVFFTGMILDILPEEKIISYTSAGHPPQFLFGDGRLVELSRTGKIVGVDSNISYETIEIPYNKNDLLILFTDGLFEEFNSGGEEFGYARLRDLTAEKISLDMSLSYIADTLLDSVASFRDEAERNDDVALIIARM